jgi:hypothetical protein
MERQPRRFQIGIACWTRGHFREGSEAMKPNIDRTIATTCAAFLLSTSPASARNGVTVTLPDKRVAVLAQGDLEPASIGSYSVTIFKDSALMHFVAGAVFSRDGSFLRADGKPRVRFADITGDGVPELIVSKLTAGSGDQVEVDALKIDAGSITFVMRVRTDSKHDEVAELRAACRRRADSDRYRERWREC